MTSVNGSHRAELKSSTVDASLAKAILDNLCSSNLTIGSG